MTAFNKENLERLKNAVVYTGATISPGNITKSKEKHEYVLVHGGRVNQSYNFLREAQEIINIMSKELNGK